ncbi:MAG: hypothetical protein ACHQF0_13950 [Chitinophagales bacterium]
MKNLTIALIGGCMAFCSITSSAQSVQKKEVTLNEPNYNKPKLFADLPDRVDFNPNNFSGLFKLQVGQSANVPISPAFNFSGQVVSKSESSNSISVVIRSTNRAGARLVFTKVTDENDSIKYLGRIISMQHGDSYELISENNQYYFKKKGIYDLMSE